MRPPPPVPPRAAWTPAAGLALAAAAALPLAAAPVPLANPSFEQPATLFVTTNVVGWTKAPKPDDYDESGGFLWDQLTGIFKNTPPGAPDHIGNLDGAQALWLFAVPQVGLHQDTAARFEPGTAYRLTAGLVAGGGNMREGVPLEIALDWLDAAGTRRPVAVTNVIFTAAAFPARTNLTDVTLHVPPVQPADPWAGRALSVRFTSTVTADLEGGYWDVDQVRLETVPPPALAAPTLTAAGLELTLVGEPGRRLEILASDDLARPAAAWDVLGMVTNTAGSAAFTDPLDGRARRWYRARQLP